MNFKIHFRFCSLGSACDAFFIEKTDTGLQCTYLPHVSLKRFELVDFVNFTPDDKDMYLLQCSQGEDMVEGGGKFEQISHCTFLDMAVSYVDHPDPFTHDIDDYWQGKYVYVIYVVGTMESPLQGPTF